MNKSTNPVLRATGLAKTYGAGATAVEVLKSVDLELDRAEKVAIVGSSGSGKSTLLHLLAGLDKATSGEIVINGNDFSKLNDNQICAIRNQNLGFIYQFHHLLPEFTALENVLMPIMISGYISEAKHNHALELLSRLGLSKRTKHFPGQLSGGERQRVAIARAVVNSPSIVFADEPTGNLDNQTSNQVLEIFFKLQEELKTSLVIVTHDNEIAAKAAKRYRLHDGKLISHVDMNN
jgi:lipoprotein-releasing system ATP-binding protein